MRSDDFELIREVDNKKKCPECGKKFVNLGSHMKKHD